MTTNAGFNTFYVSRISFISAAVILIAGCAAGQHRQQMEDFSNSWSSGDFASAAYGVDRSRVVDADELGKMDLLALLHAGEALRLAGDDELSILAYDLTEETYSRFDEQNAVTRGAGQLGAILLNESSRAYRGNLYEAVLVNSYKGMSFLGMAQPELARVEFNRADDRTRRAVEFFAEQIEAELAALAEEEEKKQEAQSVASTMESEDTRSAVFEAVGDPARWEVYPDFVNPFVTYLHGLYFLSAAEDVSDVERARTSFERVHGMVDNESVAADLALAEGIVSGQIRREDQTSLVWVIYENGTGPILEESRVDIPLILYTQGRANRPAYAAIALPRIEPGHRANGLVRAAVGDVILAQSDSLADMERVIRTEFQRSFNGILSRSIASAVLNMFIQAEAANQAGLLGALAASALTRATTDADLRIWRALPAEWQVARFERPDEGMMNLTSSHGSTIADLALPDWPYTLVYVKQPTTHAQPAIRIIDLQGKHQALNPFPPEVLLAEVTE